MEKGDILGHEFMGEVVHSDASIHRGMHPARPSEETPDLVSRFQGVSS
jgi:hypothetical protein